MKKIMMTICLSFLAVGSMNALADARVGVVDMQKIFQTSPKAKAINASLQNQFSARKANIVKMGQNLQAEVQNYQKNQSVLDKTKLEAAQQSINQHGATLRQEQAKFQADLMAEQNKEMSTFIEGLKGAAANVAQKQGLDLVLPNNAVLYAKPTMDVTNNVLSEMK